MAVPGVCEDAQIRPDRRTLGPGLIISGNRHLEMAMAVLESAQTEERARQPRVRLAGARWIILGERQRFARERLAGAQVALHEAQGHKAPQPPNGDAAPTYRGKRSDADQVGFDVSCRIPARCRERTLQRAAQAQFV